MIPTKILPSVSCGLSAASARGQSAGPVTRLALTEKGPVNTGLKKLMMSTFLCRQWMAWFRSVPVLCRNRHFVLVPVPVPLKDHKKRCMTFDLLVKYISEES
jgi:hypothetical protein